MAITPGTKLGSYQITSLMGAGGMSEVYRARDTKLDRDVAIKVLPEGFAKDQERLARFEREAKLLASLNHPNIASPVDETICKTLVYVGVVDGERPVSSSQRRTTSGNPVFPRTVATSPTSRTSRAETKFKCSPIPMWVTSGLSPPTAARPRCGRATDVSSSTGAKGTS